MVPGLTVVRLALLYSWLGSLDITISRVGATRCARAEGNVESSARLVCPPRLHESQVWTPHMFAPRSLFWSTKALLRWEQPPG